jgi:hypothetical protein
MKPLFYIIRKSLKNTIKELKKKPAALILYIFLIVILIASVAVSFLSPSNSVGRGSVKTYGMILSAVLLFVIYFGIKQGIDNGSSFFRLSDVNFVFTAPISPRQVLIYGFIKQLGSTFFVLIFLLFQIPNLKNNFPIKNHGILIIYFGAFLLMLSMPLIGMLLYSISSASNKARENLNRVLNAVVGILLLLFVVTVFKSGDFITAADKVLNGSYFTYIPFIGWFKIILTYAVKDIDKWFYIYLLFAAAFMLLMILALYNIKTDYYEDVLGATERREEMFKMKREGRGGISINNKKLRKARQEYKGSGAAAIFYRHMLEYKKAGFMFMDRTTMVIAATGIIFKFMMPGGNLNTVLFFSIYMLFFFSMQGKWAQELSKPYIYLIPDSSARKVFYVTLPQNMKNGIDGLVLFVIAGAVAKADIPTILLCAICYMAFGSIYVYGDILSRRIFGSVHSKNLQMFVKMFIIFVIVLPGIIGFIIMNAVLGHFGFMVYISYAALIVYNLLVSGLMLLFSKGIFERLEMN